jgi:hypothetical protein
MGAWGVLAFDNDTANDWAYALDGVDDLSVVVSALGSVKTAEGDYLDSDLACMGLAACEVLAPSARSIRIHERVHGESRPMGRGASDRSIA